MASDSHIQPPREDDPRTMQERMEAGDWYKAGPDQWYAIADASHLTTEYNNTFPFDNEKALRSSSRTTSGLALERSFCQA
jgi:hypothetical protein